MTQLQWIPCYDLSLTNYSIYNDMTQHAYTTKRMPLITLIHIHGFDLHGFTSTCTCARATLLTPTRLISDTHIFQTKILARNPREFTQVPVCSVHTKRKFCEKSKPFTITHSFVEALMYIWRSDEACGYQMGDFNENYLIYINDNIIVSKRALFIIASSIPSNCSYGNANQETTIQDMEFLISPIFLLSLHVFLFMCSFIGIQLHNESNNIICLMNLNDKNKSYRNLYSLTYGELIAQFRFIEGSIFFKISFVQFIYVPVFSVTKFFRNIVDIDWKLYDRIRHVKIRLMIFRD